MGADGCGQGVLDHFLRHVGRRVVGAGGHPVRRGAAVLGNGHQVLEQVAEHLRVNGLVAAVGGVLRCGPVVFAQDGEQPRLFGVGSEVVGVGQRQQAIVLVAGEQGAVQKPGAGQRAVDGRVLVRRARTGGLVEPFVEQESQDAAVVVAAGFPAGEGFVKGFRREVAVLFEYPGEHGSDEMPQHGFPVSLLPGGVAAGLAVLAQRPAVGDLFVELPPDAFGGHGIRQRTGHYGGFLVELVVDALDGAQRPGRRGVRVKLGRHSGVALAADGQAGGGGFPVFVRLDHQQYGHFGGDGIGEGGGGDGRILPEQDRVVRCFGVGGSHHGHADRFVGSVGLFDLDFAGFLVGVGLPVAGFGLLRFAMQLNLPLQVGSEFLPAGQQTEYFRRRPAFGQGLADGAGVPIVLSAAGCVGGSNVVQGGADFQQKLGSLLRPAIKEPPLLDQGDVLVRCAAADDVPDVAVGEDAQGSGLAVSIAGDIAADLLFGTLGAGFALAVEVIAHGLGLQDSPGRRVAAQRVGRIPQHNVRSVPVNLVFPQLVSGGETQESQRRVDEMGYGVRFAVIGIGGQQPAVFVQRSSGFHSGWHYGAPA